MATGGRVEGCAVRHSRRDEARNAPEFVGCLAAPKAPVALMVAQKRKRSSTEGENTTLMAKFLGRDAHTFSTGAKLYHDYISGEQEVELVGYLSGLSIHPLVPKNGFAVHASTRELCGVFVTQPGLRREPVKRLNLPYFRARTRAIAEVCAAFHARLWEICHQNMPEAVAYKQIVCALNHGCC